MPQILVETKTHPSVSDRSPLSPADKETIAFVLCWNLQADVKPDEIITIAIHYDIVQVLLTGGRVALVPVDTFKSILRVQQQKQEQEVAYVEQLEQRLLTQTVEIEVDKIGKIYRVWRDVKLLGVFYCISKKNWGAEPCDAEPIEGYKSAEYAQNAIIWAAYTSAQAA